MLAIIPAPFALALEPIPDKLVVLTFDDSVASQYSVVRPLLKRYKFSATFFITEGFTFPTNKTDYLTWEQIAELHKDGFEIGNHTRDHASATAKNFERLPEQIEAINARCREHGIPRPTSFGYPGNKIDPGALPILKKLGFRFARRGGAPEYPYEGGRGFAYEPGVDHPLLIPSAGDARPYWTLEDFQRAAQQAKHGKIAVLQFHGVPDNEHPWVNTPPELFAQYMKYLHENGYQAIALRDLARYVDADNAPADSFAIIEKRKAARPETLVKGEVLDADTGRPVAAHIHVQDEHGAWHRPFTTANPDPAARNEKGNPGGTNAPAMPPTLSAETFAVFLVPGRYTVTVERGKEYQPLKREIVVGKEALELKLPLRH
ncbi:MAG: polysaccharide deacetylase family protein [Verrucomicrobia bacterium]|nr:polysaccharide deacetylase family protein [Verrucomicrobiota bacterium]